MKWITREKVKVDRVACPWLIKKFVDKDAEFVFVPADKVMAEAMRLDAIPYDVKDVELGHRGKECSFEAILKKYKLTGDPALVPSEPPSIPFDQASGGREARRLSRSAPPRVQRKRRTTLSRCC